MRLVQTYVFATCALLSGAPSVAYAAEGALSEVIDICTHGEYNREEAALKFVAAGWSLVTDTNQTDILPVLADGALITNTVVPRHGGPYSTDKSTGALPNLDEWPEFLIDRTASGKLTILWNKGTPLSLLMMWNSSLDPLAPNLICKLFTQRSAQSDKVMQTIDEFGGHPTMRTRGMVDFIRWTFKGHDYDAPHKGRLGLIGKFGLLPNAIVPEPQIGAGASSVSVLALDKRSFSDRFDRGPYASLVVDVVRDTKEAQR